MLVLERKKHERIRLSDGIVITVVSISRGRVKLGIEAPRSTLVARAELLKDLPPTSNPEKQ